MTSTIVEIPHALGRDTARQRLRDNIGDIGRHIPGGIAALDTRWQSADRLEIELAALGQRVSATVEVEDRLVRVAFELPGMLSFMAGAITAAVRREAGQLLLPGKDPRRTD